LAYDAVQQGTGFGFGDGKTDRYYVEGWKSLNQSLTWTFRTTAPAEFKLLIKYLAPAESAGGQYVIKLDGKEFQQDVVNGKENTTVVTKEPGTVSLQPGTHTMSIVPLTISKTELMKLLEVQLITVPKAIGK
jgi:hypothetical protein